MPQAGRCPGQRRARRPGDCSSLVAEQQMHIHEAATKKGSSGPTEKNHISINPTFLLGLWFHIRKNVCKNMHYFDSFAMSYLILRPFPKMLECLKLTFQFIAMPCNYRGQ